MKRFGWMALLLASGAAALAQDDAPKPDDIFKRLDKNTDGKLVKDEVPEEQVRFFERLLRLGDDDKNGELTRSEYDKATADQPDPQRRGDGPGPGGRGPEFDPRQFFDRMDANKDGKLTRDELPEFMRDRMGRVFDELKKDALTFEDFQEARQRFGQGIGGGRPPMGNPAETFGRLDQNGDGKLKLDEIPEPTRRFFGQMFERLGKGPDGEITKDEFVKAAEQFRQDGERRPEGDRRPDGSRPPEGERRPGDAPRGSGGPGGPGGFRPRFFQILDKDQNGRLSKSELDKAAALLAELDENKDNELDPREFFGPPPAGFAPGGGFGGGRPPEGGTRPAEGDRPRRPDAEGTPRPDGDRPRADADRPRPEGGRPEGRQRDPGQFDDLLKRADKNGDGKLSRDEAPDRLRENFARADANGDGFVDASELRQLFGREGGDRSNRPEGRRRDRQPEDKAPDSESK